MDELLSILFIVCIFFGGRWIYKYFTEPKPSPYIQSIYNNPTTYKSHESPEKDCSNLEPNNPYDEGTGHYAGYEWGQEGNDCGGNSDSFIEGCEDYQEQEAAYDMCLSN